MKKITSFSLVQLSFYTSFFVLLLLFRHANSQLNVEEQSVLMSIKRHWQNPPTLSHWIPSNSSTHCSWPQVTCTGGSVTLISFRNLNISGTVPPNICDLKNLTAIDLSLNYFVSSGFPKPIYNCSRLRHLNLSQNHFAGTIPDDIDRMSRLRGLDLGANDFSGNIPASIGRLTKLRVFQLQMCRFTGSFPPEMGNLSNLEVLVLAYNTRMTLTKLPSSYMKLKKLKFLCATSSNLVGEIPDTIGEMAALEHLDLCKNNLSGKIPSRLFMLKNLRIVYLCKNKLSGDIPRVVEALNMEVIDLSENHLMGTIPDDFGRLSKLSGLSLSFNQLYGRIPKSIGNLAFLKLSSLNLSSNQFTGKIPRGFENEAYASSFLNNPGLCTESPYVNVDSCNFKLRSMSKISTKRLVWIIVLAVAVPSLLVLFYMIRNKRKRKHCLDSVVELNSFQKLNFTESDILSQLEEENVIGRGGAGTVYRVAVNPPHDHVTVKRFLNNEYPDKNLEKQFHTEVEILRSTRHEHIVKLLDSISSERSKLLVYEYLENRSLDLWLHAKNRASTALDWPKRRQIAIGAAQGLSFMHHDCSPPIVHRDVKSSNILLDSEFNEKIGDFGLAKMLINQGESVDVSVVAGSVGYIAPEYINTSQINEKIDVYSFGVVLLELATGRTATEGWDEYTSLAQWARRHIQEGNPAVDALDREVKELHCLDEMCRVFYLGIACTDPVATSRPSMKEVLEMLLLGYQPLVFGEKNDANDCHASPLLKNSNREKVTENEAANLVPSFD